MANVIGSYAVKSKLGSGSFGEVFKVTKNNKIFAIKKVIRIDDSALQEVKILQMVNLETIITYVEAFVSNGALCIVMEFADSGTLTSYIQTYGALPSWMDMSGAEWYVWRLLSHLSHALNYLHTFQPVPIMHRDLKPDNILGITGITIELEKGNHMYFKLADFGIAKLLNKDAQGLFYANTCIGTPIYMAPEILNGQDYTFSADMWSLGAVISFYCNIGKHLFPNAKSILTWPGGKSSLPRHYSIELRQLVADLLNPAAWKRPSAVEVKKECTNDRKEMGRHGVPDSSSNNNDAGSWCTIS